MRCGVVTARAAWRGRAISGGRACLPGIRSSSLRECAAGIVGKGTIGKLTTPRALTPDSRSTGSRLFSPSRSRSFPFPLVPSCSLSARSFVKSFLGSVLSCDSHRVFIRSPSSLLRPALATARPSVRPSVRPFPLFTPLRPFLTIAAGSPTYLPLEATNRRLVERTSERASERERTSGRLSIIDSDSRAPYCRSTHRRW